MEKKHLVLVLPYLGVISIYLGVITRTKLQKTFKGVLNCCKLELFLNVKPDFQFKDPIPKDLTSGVVYTFQCGLCYESYYGDSIRHFDLRSGEHIAV